MAQPLEDAADSKKIEDMLKLTQDDIGLAVTPMAYFAQFDLDVPCVAMVTASHNDNGWTGVKMGANRPLTFGPDEMTRLKQIVLNAEFNKGYSLVSTASHAWISGNGINNYIGNYGWSIIALTFLINLAIFPLRHKSVVSMKKMQELQPEIKAIQDRYGKMKATDPGRQKMNQELMDLYKQRGVNPSGGCVPEQHLDTLVDYEAIAKVGAIMGSGGAIVMDEDTCMVDMARFFMDFVQDESCGKCTPCREGTRRLLQILEKICEGRGEPADLETLEELSAIIKEASLCGLGQTGPNPVLSTLRYFRDEYEAHIHEKRCPAKRCVALLKFEVDPEICTKCGLCSRACPVEAIAWKKKEVARIDREKCIKCMTCFDKCKFGAIF